MSLSLPGAQQPATQTATAEPNLGTDTPSSFTPIKSPPLVLAFLAIGLFSGAMIFVFSWRRIQLRRGWSFITVVPLNNMNANTANHSDVESPIVYLTRPNLWDLTSERSGDKKGPEVDIRWINLMPLSAKTVLDSPIVTAADKPRQQQHSFNNILQQRIPNLNPLSRRNHRRPSSASSSLSLARLDNEKKSSVVDDGMKTKMQVAITIVLPSPEYPIHIKNRNIDNHHRHGEGKTMDRQKMTDYCIGMYECSWHE
ncbi:hypothetical protein BYT27DRAFT_7249719 [Phlegmacium glaucopus]|nr:hypothetical protein BYT27DRAFT_7249719 [Phlegmacium glaucopus]